MYPASVLVFTVLLTWGLMTFAIPQFQSIFANFNAPLPLATQYIIALTECLRKYHYLIMISSGALPISFLCCYRSFDHIKRYTQDALLRLPFIGTVYRFKLVAQWTNILALTLKSGMRLQEALLLANNTLTHLSLKTSCHTLIHKVTSGHKLHQALAQITFFNTSERYLIEMGETTTTLPLVLERISQESLNSIEHKLDSLSKWIEPVIMLLLAGIAGSLIITMYLPIFKIGTLL